MTQRGLYADPEKAALTVRTITSWMAGTATHSMGAWKEAGGTCLKKACPMSWYGKLDADNLIEKDGKRLVRKRRARKQHTLLVKGQLERKLPGYGEGTVTVKGIVNTEAKLNNRKCPAGWLTPTAAQLLRMHLNLVGIIRKILPVAAVAFEVNRFSFMDLENNGKVKDYYTGLKHQCNIQTEQGLNAYIADMLA